MEFAEAVRFNLLHYDMKIENGECILSPKNSPIAPPEKEYVSETTLLKSVKDSVIQECCVRSGRFIISSETKYQAIWVDIVTKHGDLNTLRKYSSMNIMFGRQGSYKGYRFLEKLGFSFQGKNAEGTMKDILKLCRSFNLTIEMTINAKDGTLIHFNMKN